MFGKEKPTTSGAVAAATLPVTAIPTEFYGGANPVVTFKQTKKEVEPSASGGLLSASEKKRLDQSTMMGSSEVLHPANLFGNRRFLIAGGAVVFVLALLGAGGYYWLSSRPAAPLPPPVQPEPSPAAAELVVPTTTPALPLVEETVSSTPAEPPPAPQPPGLAFPSLLLGDGTDTDGDGLSDTEEELFRTDIALPDSDQDKFNDAHEVFNLYDPAVGGPTKLTDSGAVKTFNNSVFGYSFYYPSAWAVGNVDEAYRSVLVSTVTGEYIEVSVFDKNIDTAFNEWLAAQAPGEQIQQLTSFETAAKNYGFRRQDYLVYYFIAPTRIYTIIYHSANATAVNYRSVIKMMARSLRFADTALAPIERTIEPGISTSSVSIPPPPAPAVTSTPPTGASSTPL